jgi:hypothetical protein
VRTREIYVTQVTPGTGHDLIRHQYRPHLSGIRVTDAVKDLGRLDLADEER